MTKNVGGIEKILRIIVGIALLAWGFILSDPINWWGAVGAVPLFTALMGWCPLYSIIGVNTNKS
ncbi:MAG: DUF2892 domain-containing protein [endosymbiont of Seepiophila jonesi]|uniref:DUF2892 domain-containing protein n=1 Tax=endosymbiont of Lamellibrachia luymesi TaxID=2200907 RepID=A0A370DU28_9GAMM|nr:MAG: DUF2892 domain-containing protein [endosymbiont of Lamellibrachia luymesi]RDH91409.1 MAG: DUF2892 domain-containing protein [endosymbiont of Seepiophila jonesi]